MATIYLACQVVYEYDHDTYCQCYVKSGYEAFAAFTFFELAQEHVNEKNLEYYRKYSFDFMNYAPIEGSNVFINQIQLAQKKYSFGFDFCSREATTKALRQLTDEQLLGFITEIDLSFYEVRGVQLYA